jgi:hypothetical protein
VKLVIIFLDNRLVKRRRMYSNLHISMPLMPGREHGIICVSVINREWNSKKNIPIIKFQNPILSGANSKFQKPNSKKNHKH